MIRDVSFSPPNSLILLMDHTSGQPPESMYGQLVAATDSCVAIGTRAEQDGETHVVLSDNFGPLRISSRHMVFDGMIRVSSGELSVVDAMNRVVICIPVLGVTNLRLRIWVNDLNEPDEIAILVG
jgi:hypothetical protein